MGRNILRYYVMIMPRVKNIYNKILKPKKSKICMPHTLLFAQSLVQLTTIYATHTLNKQMQQEPPDCLPVAILRRVI